MILDIIGHLSNIAGFASAIFAVLVWFRLRAFDRLKQPISVYLTSDHRRIELPLQMLLGDLTRAETLGRIGMIPMQEPGRRFSLQYLSNPDFIAAINAIRDGQTDTLEIKCSDAEIDQFNL